MRTVLRGGSVVDGSGAPARAADVLLEGGTIAAVGPLDRATRRDAEEVDCTGLVVAPGFIDVHTHYDAQVLWDPALTPVVVARRHHRGDGQLRLRHRADAARGSRRLIARMLENVEGMTLEALERGHPVGLRDVPRVPRRRREAAAPHQRRARSSATRPCAST